MRNGPDQKSTLPKADKTVIRLGPIALLCAVGVAEPASAHDITDAVFSDRSGSCAAYADTHSATATDVQNATTHSAAISITVDGETCKIASNAVPNHDFNATGRFATRFSEKEQVFIVPATPVAAEHPTPLSLRYDNAVFLNGVKLDLMAAGYYGVGDGNIGCNDMNTPFRYDPLGVTDKFGADEHNAHTQPDGTYHYHGNPMAMFQQSDATEPSPVIGFAADGFPIFGSFIADGDEVRPAKSSYQLKSGERDGGPGGTYDGTFIDDWEYVEGSGDSFVIADNDIAAVQNQWPVFPPRHGLDFY
ncbi:YHYH protein [Antarctobacter heliothermus]|uniref:YHYH protein n=1 Tax=Antarctobacter heliothermus TaxID=74033 RepID=A0A239FRA4_9RHOB|nr:YHYH protein [Antarctobacter heliothermus]SNS59616.1 YHYH protein [Antarctobacter heliothermus]